MRRRSQHKTKARRSSSGARSSKQRKVWFCVLDLNGRIIETNRGGPLVSQSRRFAERMARAHFGTVGRLTVETLETRGRKTDPRVLAAWREWEFGEYQPHPAAEAAAKVGLPVDHSLKGTLRSRKMPAPKKLTYLELTDKHFGPFKSQDQRLKRRDTLERLIRRLHQSRATDASALFNPSKANGINSGGYSANRRIKHLSY